MDTAPDEKMKKYKKQIKRMGKLLRHIWDASEPILQDGSGDTNHNNSNSNTTEPNVDTSNRIRYLTHVGERLDDTTSIYHKVGKHGWEALAHDIAQVYHYYHQQQQQKNHPNHHPISQQQQQQQQHIQTLFRDIHPDLEKIMMEYSHPCTSTNATNTNTTTNHHHHDGTHPMSTTSTTIQNVSSSSNNSNHNSNSNNEFAEKEQKYLEALHTFIQEQWSNTHSSSSHSHSTTTTSSNNAMKQAQQLLLGFRGRVTKTGTSGSRYDVNYFNARQRRFRSRIEVARFLQVLSPEEPPVGTSSSHDKNVSSSGTPTTLKNHPNNNNNNGPSTPTTTTTTTTTITTQ